MLEQSARRPIDIVNVYICDEDWEEALGDLSSYDAVAWTGSTMTIYIDNELTRRQKALCDRVFELGIPQFGSCYGVQLASMVAGGLCNANPRGYEVGIGRKITLTSDGRSHPMFDSKPAVFDVFMTHFDEVTHMPKNSLLLASNSWTHVQAASVRHKKGEVGDVLRSISVLL